MNFQLPVNGKDQAHTYDETLSGAQAMVTRIRQFDQSAADECVRLGSWMAKMKLQLAHGEWGRWLDKSNVPRTLAKRSVRLAATFGSAGSIDWYTVRTKIEEFNQVYPAAAINVAWPEWMASPHAPTQPENFGSNGTHLERPDVSRRQLELAAGIRKPAPVGPIQTEDGTEFDQDELDEFLASPRVEAPEAEPLPWDDTPQAPISCTGRDAGNAVAPGLNLTAPAAAGAQPTAAGALPGTGALAALPPPAGPDAYGAGSALPSPAFAGAQHSFQVEGATVGGASGVTTTGRILRESGNVGAEPRITTEFAESAEKGASGIQLKLESLYAQATRAARAALDAAKYFGELQLRELERAAAEFAERVESIGKMRAA